MKIKESMKDYINIIVCLECLLKQLVHIDFSRKVAIVPRLVTDKLNFIIAF